MSVRGVLALAGWPDVALGDGAWSGVDAAARSIVLAHLAGPGAPAAAVATNEDRSVRAVLAGTLLNRRELRAHLGGRHAFGSRDDADVLIHLYEERGIQCVKALRGPFACALWDANVGRLLLARDQLGLVPLFWAVDGRRLAASSSLPALMALPGLAGPWDPAALDAFLVLGAVPAPMTLYPGVRQLRPGELAVWEGGRARMQRYWQPTFPERRMGRRDLARLVREQALEAIRLRQTGVAPGLLLSGGLDAAAVLALAAADRRPPVRAYTAAAPGADDEARAAARLAARAGVAHVVVDAGVDWPAAVDRLLAAHGVPAGGMGDVVVQLAAERAAADVGVALAGTGGMEVFGGGAAARFADRVRRFRALPALVRETAEVWMRVAPAGWTGRLEGLVGADRLAPLEMYGRTVAVFHPEERQALYTEEALASLGDPRPWPALGAVFAEAAGAGAEDVDDVFHYVDLVLRLPARAALAATAAACGLDLRFPFADHRLAQVAASVAPGARGNARERELLLRAAIEGLVPAAVLGRPHAGPALPARAWATGSLRALLEDTLAPARVAAQAVFRPETVSRLRREHLDGVADHGRRLWALVLATRWLERQALPAAPAVRVAG
ncbi:MAG TPA: asparagine synthase-related protein [Candidatus Binatia bacterium]|nr:asparagine synthase-related protein [Candidatus Binatia bacterium]